MMDWKEKKVLVIGTGISGIAATDLLCEVGANVVLYDGNEQLKEETIRAKLEKFQNVQIEIGTLKEETKSIVGYVVLSPGVSY